MKILPATTNKAITPTNSSNSAAPVEKNQGQPVKTGSRGGNIIETISPSGKLKTPELLKMTAVIKLENTGKTNKARKKEKTQLATLERMSPPATMKNTGPEPILKQKVKPAGEDTGAAGKTTASDLDKLPIPKLMTSQQPAQGSSIDQLI